MLFINNRLSKKVNEIFKQRFNFSDEAIGLLQDAHINAVLSIIYSETMNYLEEQKESEVLEKLDKLTMVGDFKTNLNSFKEMQLLIFSQYEKFPKLQKRIDKKVENLEEKLFIDFLKSLDEPTAFEFFTVMEEEVKKTVGLQKLLMSKKEDV